MNPPPNPQPSIPPADPFCSHEYTVPGILGNYEMDAEQTIGPCPRQSQLGQL